MDLTPSLESAAEPDTTRDSEIRYYLYHWRYCMSIQHSYFSFVLNISTTVTGGSVLSALGLQLCIAIENSL